MSALEGFSVQLSLLVRCALVVFVLISAAMAMAVIAVARRVPWLVHALQIAIEREGPRPPVPFSHE